MMLVGVALAPAPLRAGAPPAAPAIAATPAPDTTPAAEPPAPLPEDLPDPLRSVIMQIHDAVGPGMAAAAEPPGPFPLPEDLPDPARFMVVQLHGEVGLGMAAVVERVAGDLGPGDILLLDINTFGGRVDAAVRIRDTLLGLAQQQVRTVAYVHPRAISAGALIALATDIIVVAPGATMGAATPVTIEGGEMKPVEEKTVSYMRKEMRSTAEARGRDGDIAEAMVDTDIEIPGLIERGKLLTLDGRQALAWSVASVEADTRDALIAALGYGPDGRAFTVDQADWSWAEQVAAFLSGSLLSGLLMSIGMLAIMIGLYTGGSPLPLTIGAVCLGLFFFGHHVVNLVGFEELLIFGLGVALIVFEALSPGLGVPGALGVLLIALSLVMGLLDLDQVPLTVQWHEGWITRALALVFGSIAITAVLAYATFRALPETRLGRRFMLEAAISGRATDQSEAEGQTVIGQTGVAVSSLRPSGKVRVGDRRLDAVAERGYVLAGTPIEVVGLRGFSVIVRPARGHEPAGAAPPAASAAPAPTEEEASVTKEPS